MDPRLARPKSSIEHASCYTARSGSAMIAPRKVLRGSTPLGLAGLRGARGGRSGAVERGAALSDHIDFMGCMISLVLQSAC